MTFEYFIKLLSTRQIAKINGYYTIEYKELNPEKKGLFLFRPTFPKWIAKLLRINLDYPPVLYASMKHDYAFEMASHLDCSCISKLYESYRFLNTLTFMNDIHKHNYITHKDYIKPVFILAAGVLLYTVDWLWYYNIIKTEKY